MLMLIGSKNVTANYQECIEKIKCPNEGKAIETLPQEEQHKTYHCRVNREYECSQHETETERCFRKYPCPHDNENIDHLSEEEKRSVKQCRVERYLKCE